MMQEAAARRPFLFSPQGHREHREYFFYCLLEPGDRECENEYMEAALVAPVKSKPLCSLCLCGE